MKIKPYLDDKMFKSGLQSFLLTYKEYAKDHKYAPQLDNKLFKYWLQLLILPQKKHSQNFKEIFCDQKYEGYFIRGQEVLIADNIRIKLLFLLSRTYSAAKRHPGKAPSAPILGVIHGNTLDEYKKLINVDLDRLILQRQHPLFRILDPTQSQVKKLKQALYESYSKPLLINKDDISTKKASYIKNAIKRKQETILLDLDILVSAKQTNKLYTFLISIWPYARDGNKILEEVFDKLYDEYDYQLVEKGKHISMLNKIAELAKAWIDKKYLSAHSFYVNGMNTIAKEIDEISYPLNKLYSAFLDSLAEHLVVFKVVGRCEKCGYIFKYKIGKKYCSPMKEGKVCAKRAADSRYYERHKTKLKIQRLKSAKI